MNAIGQLIATATPRTLEVRVSARGDLVDRHEELARELQRWLDAAGADSLAQDSDVRHLNDQLVALETEIDAAAVTIRVGSMPAYQWANLLRRHGPTREHREQGLDHDPDEFPPAALADAVVDPPITVDEAKELRNTLPYAEWNKLWFAVLGLNLEETPSPKLGAATASLLASGPSSTPASPEGSLAEPS